MCSGWEREYAFTLVRWMALRAGINRRTFSDGIRIERSAPFMVYDGYETWPLLVCTRSEAKLLPKQFQQYAVDKLGIHNGPGADGALVGFALFETLPYPKGASERAGERAGPYPENGDRFAWRDRYNLALLEEPAIRANVDKGIGLIRAELTRLDDLWCSSSHG